MLSLLSLLHLLHVLLFLLLILLFHLLLPAIVHAIGAVADARLALAGTLGAGGQVVPLLRPCTSSLGRVVALLP